MIYTGYLFGYAFSFSSSAFVNNEVNYAMLITYPLIVLFDLFF